MKRLVIRTALPLDAAQIANDLINSEGTCTCSRVLRRMDAKLVLFTAVPSQGQLVAAAYCFSCARQINETLHTLRRTMYTNTETAPPERLSK